MSLTGDDIELLLAREVDELHRIATHADGEVGILGLLRMLHGVLQFVHAKDIDVEVVGTLIEIAIHHVDERVGALTVVVTECLGSNGLRVGDAVEGIVVRQLRQ